MHDDAWSLVTAYLTRKKIKDIYGHNGYWVSQQNYETIQLYSGTAHLPAWIRYSPPVSIF